MHFIKTFLIMFVTFCFLCCSSLALAKTHISEELINAAKKEGEINWATGITRPVAEPVANKFEETYDIDVNLTRIGTEALMGRFMTEMRLGACRFDTLTTGKPPIGVYKEKDWVKQYNSPRLDEMDQDLIKNSFHEPNGWWTPTALDFQLMAYNSEEVSKDDAPQNWTDLLDPKYKGMIGYADPRYSGTALLNVSALADFYGWDYFTKLGKNDLSISRGHGALVQTMIAGETPIAGEMLFFVGGSAAIKGEPIEIVYPTDGAVPTPWQSFISTDAPNPNAAKLFIEFLLTQETQRLLVEKGTLYPVVPGIKPPEGFRSVEDIKTMPVDVHKTERLSEEIQEVFWERID